MSSGILGPPNTDVATPLATQTAAARNAPTHHTYFCSTLPSTRLARYCYVNVVCPFIQSSFIYFRKISR